MLRKPDDCLIPPTDGEVAEAIDFVMMNPPFYASEEEMTVTAEKKARPPHSACTGVACEMVCEGGEVAFVDRLLQESLALREQVGWYTSMLGKASSVEAIVAKLRENGIGNYAVTEFVQGRKTRRWAVGWSFRPMRPSQNAARGFRSAAWRNLLPSIVDVELLTCPINSGVGRLTDCIRKTVGDLALLSWVWDGSSLRGIGRAKENVWSRAWRRKRRFDKEQGHRSADAVMSADEGCRFGFAISIRVGMNTAAVYLSWREGHDRALFESFGGFLQRLLQSLEA